MLISSKAPSRNGVGITGSSPSIVVTLGLLRLLEISFRLSRCLSYEAFLEYVFVNLDPETRLLRYLDIAVTNRELLDDQPPVEFRSPHAVLEVLGLLDRGEHVQAGRLDDPGAPGVRDGALSALAHHGGDAHGLAYAARTSHVRLHDGHAAAVDQALEVEQRRFLFATRDRDLHRLGERTVPVVLIGHERLFDPVRPELLKAPGAADRIHSVGPALPDVHHQIEVVPGCLPGRSHQRDVEFRVLAERTPAELDRLEAGLRLLID